MIYGTIGLLSSKTIHIKMGDVIMLRFEKKDTETVINYMMHIDLNYRFYIDDMNGELYYGVWSEIEQMNIPIYLDGDGFFKWGRATFDLPKFVEENGLERMKKLYQFYLENK